MTNCVNCASRMEEQLMKTTNDAKKRFRGMLLFALLCAALAFFLSGCGFKNELLDSRMQVFVQSLGENDPDEVLRLFHPDVPVSREKFTEWFDTVRGIWQPGESDKIELRGININKTLKRGDGKAAGDTVYKGTYVVKSGEAVYAVDMTYQITDGGEGITYLNFAVGQKTGAWVYIAVGVVAAFILWTIVDIIRKRPKYFVVLILVALFLHLTITVNGVRYGIPVGCIGYWISRYAEKKKARVTQDEG